MHVNNRLHLSFHQNSMHVNSILQVQHDDKQVGMDVSKCMAMHLTILDIKCIGISGAIGDNLAMIRGAA